MLLPVLQHPNPILNLKSDPVKDVHSPAFKSLVKTMLEIVKSENALGLAGIQLGVPQQVIVVSADAKNYIVMINPKILPNQAEERVSLEMCLSYPKQVRIIRPSFVTVQYLDEGGESKELTAVGMLCNVICHEVDHCLLGQGIWDYDL